MKVGLLSNDLIRWCAQLAGGIMTWLHAKARLLRHHKTKEFYIIYQADQNEQVEPDGANSLIFMLLVLR